MKGNPAVPGGPLTSKPMWPKMVGHIGFFVLGAAGRSQ